MKSKNDYLEIFGVSVQQMQALIAEGMKGGGDWCDLFFEDTSYSDLLLRDGKVSSGGSHIDYGCGVRVLCGEKTGYAYAESTDCPALLSAARAASAIASGGRTGKLPAAIAAATHGTGNWYGMRSDWRGTEASAFVPVLEKIDALIRAKDSRADKVMAMLSWQVSDILMYNSLGELTTDTRPMGSISVTTVFQQGGRTEMTTASRSFRMGSEMISDSLTEEIASDAVRGVDERFDARRPKGDWHTHLSATGKRHTHPHKATPP